MITVLAIDPGARQQASTLEKRGTGVALLQFSDNEPPTLVWTYLISGGTDSLLGTLTGTMYWGPIQEWFKLADIVIVENFRLREARANIEPLEMVGVVRGIGAAQGKRVIVQEPADRTIVSHDDLKRVGMWPGGAGHADEAQAVRHGLAWALKTGNRPTVELLAPDPGEDEDDARSGPSSW